MRRKKIFLIAFYIFCFVGVILLTGCASTITAKPGDGIPYYLPKPYLLITKNLSHIVEKSLENRDEKGNVKSIERTFELLKTDSKEGDTYTFQIIYLPDLTQKYFLDIQSRTGEIKTTISLVDGWKLVGLNLDANAKTSEIIQAIGQAIGEVIPTLPTKGIKPEEEKKAEKVKKEEKKVGLWLYEIKFENGQMRYELVMQWELK